VKIEMAKCDRCGVVFDPSKGGFGLQLTTDTGCVNMTLYHPAAEAPDGYEHMCGQECLVKRLVQTITALDPATSYNPEYQKYKIPVFPIPNRTEGDNA